MLIDNQAAMNGYILYRPTPGGPRTAGYGAYGAETDASCEQQCGPGQSLVRDAAGPGCGCYDTVGYPNVTNPVGYSPPDTNSPWWQQLLQTAGQVVPAIVNPNYRPQGQYVAPKPASGVPGWVWVGGGVAALLVVTGVVAAKGRKSRR